MPDNVRQPNVMYATPINPNFGIIKYNETEVKRSINTEIFKFHIDFPIEASMYTNKTRKIKDITAANNRML